MKPIDSCGHLELQTGQRIRDNDEAKQLDADSLRIWLKTDEKIDASTRACQAWLVTEWSTSGKYLSIDAVEGDLGDQLRLEQYKDCFADDAAAKTLAVSLAERQSPALV
jgi:hypothetical protein